MYEHTCTLTAGLREVLWFSIPDAMKSEGEDAPDGERASVVDNERPIRSGDGCECKCAEGKLRLHAEYRADEW